MANYEEKIKALFGDEEFVKRFHEVSGPDELKKLFADFGTELTDEEMAEMINVAVQEGEVEFDEATLEDVSGGVIATLSAILAASWSLAVRTYGSPEKAVREIGIYWARKLGYKG